MNPSANSTLQTMQDFHDAMARLEKVLPVARKGTPAGDEYERLALLITDWEARNVAVERSTDPIGLIRFAMESRGMQAADLAPAIPQDQAEAVLGKEIALTPAMVQWFHENLQLPLEVLVQPYSLEARKVQ